MKKIEISHLTMRALWEKKWKHESFPGGSGGGGERTASIATWKIRPLSTF